MHVVIDNIPSGDLVMYILQGLGILVTLFLGVIALQPTLREFPRLKLNLQTATYFQNQWEYTLPKVTLYVSNQSRRSATLVSFAIYETGNAKRIPPSRKKLMNDDETPLEIMEGHVHGLTIVIPKTELRRIEVVTAQSTLFGKSCWRVSRAQIAVANRQIHRVRKALADAAERQALKNLIDHP